MHVCKSLVGKSERIEALLGLDLCERVSSKLILKIECRLNSTGLAYCPVVTFYENENVNVVSIKD